MKLNRLKFHSHWCQKEVLGRFTAEAMECDPFHFVCAGRAGHRLRRGDVNGPVWSGFRRPHAEQRVSPGCCCQYEWRPNGARLQEAKAGLEPETVYTPPSTTPLPWSPLKLPKLKVHPVCVEMIYLWLMCFKCVFKVSRPKVFYMVNIIVLLDWLSSLH